MLRDWTDSDKVNKLSVHAERFFTRLIMKVDDHGCFHADTRILKANLFTLQLDIIREADMLRWMDECQKAGLIVLYENSGKQYLQITDFNQRLRQKKQKYPLPTDDGHMTDNRPPEVEVEVEGKGIPPQLIGSNLFRQPNIPTKDKVIEVFSRAGGTKEMADKFFEVNEGTGWFYRGSPITNFSNFVPGFIDAWKKNHREDALTNKQKTKEQKEHEEKIAKMKQTL